MPQEPDAKPRGGGTGTMRVLRHSDAWRRQLPQESRKGSRGSRSEALHLLRFRSTSWRRLREEPDAYPRRRSACVTVVLEDR